MRRWSGLLTTARGTLRPVEEGVAGSNLVLHLPRRIAEELLARSRAELPNESCALLSGDLAGGQVSRLHPARNSDQSPLRYTIDEDDLLRITLDIDEAGVDLVAIYHSHTRSPAIPSATDRRQAATYPKPFHLLASLTDSDVPPERALRSWRIQGGHAFEVRLAIE